MKTFQFKSRQEIGRTREEVFDFFSRAENLEKMTPDWLNFKILTASPIVMNEGTLINYRIRLLGIPLNWKTEITAWDPPFRFVDTQLKGPYRQWIHEHRFEEINGVTIMHDSVEYSFAGGPLSGIMNKYLIRPRINAIFRFRQQIIDTIFAHHKVQFRK